jgi:hypothetical protein
MIFSFWVDQSCNLKTTLLGVDWRVRPRTGPVHTLFSVKKHFTKLALHNSITCAKYRKMPLNGRNGLVVGTTTSGISEGGIRHTAIFDGNGLIGTFY